jgi:hypothetical protein
VAVIKVRIFESMDYWLECIKEAFEDAGIKATEDQIDQVTKWVEGAHENYGMAHGHHCISNPKDEEIRELKKELRIERDKVVCPECKGSRRKIDYGPYHSGESECFKCKGEGKVLQ